MIKREIYLKKIRPLYNEKSLIKIIYGLRRTGKSVLLFQIIEELKKQNVKDENIIYINFESLEFSDIKNAKDLDNYIKNNTKNSKLTYVFFDEVQKVNEFEKALNSLRVTNKYSIFVTGSNSKMTFKELSTDLTGRYISFRINPLSFKEIIEITNAKEKDYKKLLFNIFEWGSLPQVYSFNEEFVKRNYISDIYDSIILKDVVDRIGITDITGFNKIFQYLLEIEGKEFSATKVLKYLEREYRLISTETLYNYIEALCSTFIMNRVYRYDVHGKSVLKTLNKFYVSDLGIKTIKSNGKEINYSRSLENIIYNDLIIKGYEVYIGKTETGEIDFIANKNNEVNYIQVCYSLKDEKTRAREFDAFKAINDNYPKYIISLDEENYSKDGIININAIDFLINDSIN